MATNSKAVKNSTAGEAITDTQNNKGVKVSKGNLRALKGRLKGSQTIKKEETRGRKPVSIDYDKLTEYASQKIDNKIIAEMLGIGETTFYVKMAKDPEFKTAYEAGINNRKYTLEKALLKRAEGFDSEEIEEFKNAAGEIVKSKVTKKSFVPDTAALIFSLKNLYSDKYKEIVQTQTDININVNQIHQLSDDELAKIANAQVVDAIEYYIE